MATPVDSFFFTTSCVFYAAATPCVLKETQDIASLRATRRRDLFQFEAFLKAAFTAADVAQKLPHAALRVKSL